MSNPNAPNGFQVFRRLTGGSDTQGFEFRTVASGDTNAIGFGDPVITVATTGNVTLGSASTVAYAGIFFGCKYLNTSVGRVVWSPNWPGSGAGDNPQAYVCTDPDTLYVAQATNTAITAVNIGENINVSIGTPNSTAAGGYSTSSIDQSTLNTTNTLPFRVVALLSSYSKAEGTDDASAYNRVILQPNFFERKNLTGTA